MKSFEIKAIGQAGIISDVSPDELPPNALTIANNVHPIGNMLLAAAGRTQIAEVPSLFDPGHLQFVVASTGSYWVICGAGVENSPSADDKAIYTHDGTSFVDVSSSDAIYDNLLNPHNWTSCIFNGKPIVNHPQSYPQHQSAATATTDFAQLYWTGTTKWSTQGVHCEAIASHKNFLFAMAPTEGGTEYPNCVRWSDAADVGALPSSWDETDPTNLAGKVALSAEGGKCLNGATLRDSFVVYRERSIHVFDFVGGEFVFNQRTLSPTVGCVSRNAFCEHKGFHYFIATDDICVTDGNDVVSLLDGKNKLKFLGEVSQANISKSFVYALPLLGEIHFCYPVGSNYVNTILVYNVENKVFTTMSIDETYHIGAGYPANAATTWATATQNWDEPFASWLNDAAMGAFPVPYYCTIENGSTKANLRALNAIGFATDVDFEATIERTSIDFTGEDVSITVLEVYPHINSQIDLYFSIGVQHSPFDAIDWSPEVTIAAGQRKVDVRATGKYFSYRLRSNSSATWRINALTFKYEFDGLR